MDQAQKLYSYLLDTVDYYFAIIDIDTPLRGRVIDTIPGFIIIKLAHEQGIAIINVGHISTIRPSG